MNTLIVWGVVVAILAVTGALIGVWRRERDAPKADFGEDWPR